MSNFTLEDLWKTFNFVPNDDQRNAINHIAGPLFITAGPGCGKTSVLLWRTVNLIVFKNIKPDEIYLGTFTEKASLELKEGLKVLLGEASNRLNKPFDISRMYLGTIHSSCQKMLRDKKFSDSYKRPKFTLMDEIDQFFYLRENFSALINETGMSEIDVIKKVNLVLENSKSQSKFNAISNLIKLFNRLTEETIEEQLIRKQDKNLTDDEKFVLSLYVKYKSLTINNETCKVDLSTLQELALNHIKNNAKSAEQFKFIIIDEYQDTNYVQEQLFFTLAKKNKNLCIVGDDDQSLYRFRGATVENFVLFEERCKQYLGITPKKINLGKNYRSKSMIVNLYKDFINSGNWVDPQNKNNFFRVHTKNLIPESKDSFISVASPEPAKPEVVFEKIAVYVKKLITEKKVEDPNQIAFLFPALKGNAQAKRAEQALIAAGLNVYAPRAKNFFEVDESLSFFGIMLVIFGYKKPDVIRGIDHQEFVDWIERCLDKAKALITEDRILKMFVNDKKACLKRIDTDYKLLIECINQHNWNLDDIYDKNIHKNIFSQHKGLSPEASKVFSSKIIEKMVDNAVNTEKPYTIKMMIRRAVSLDWTILDLFYQLSSINYFKNMFDLAQNGTNEAPICNLGIISGYLNRFTEYNNLIITGEAIAKNWFANIFVGSFLYTLHRMGETEYENKDNLFPRGNIPFLTIHQSKGLEFPIVVLGNLRKNKGEIDFKEALARKITKRSKEPEDLITHFDVMRMFYVALSRPKNLLLLAPFKGKGQSMHEVFKKFYAENKIRSLKEVNLDDIPSEELKNKELGGIYSFTGDFLLYKRCPRQYMIYRKYGLVPSRTSTMFFGNLVHKTIDDLHYYLINQSKKR